MAESHIVSKPGKYLVLDNAEISPRSGTVKDSDLGGHVHEDCNASSCSCVT
jgi:hypothetical protein